MKGNMMMAGFSFILALGAICAVQGAERKLEDEKGGTFSTPDNGGRSYIRSGRSDFAKDNFQAEATVTIKGGSGAGCAFFGLGKGEGNANNYMEPTTAPSVYIRLAPSDFGGGSVTASVNGQDVGNASVVVGDGTHRIRMTWDAEGKRALFEVDKDWDGKQFKSDSEVTINASDVKFGTGGKGALFEIDKDWDGKQFKADAADVKFGNDDARLFIGGANGVKFEGFTSEQLTKEDIRKIEFGENFTNDPSAGTWLPVGRPAKFVESLRAGKKLTIVTMGTSLTGGTWRWPDVMMKDWLDKDFPGQVTLFNEAVGASASSVGPGNNPALSGLGKLPAVIAHKPDLVFIEFAVNDAYIPYKISLADSKKNLNTIIDKILESNP